MSTTTSPMTAIPSGSGSAEPDAAVEAIIASLLAGTLEHYVVSHNQSQYTGGVGGASACGIAAMNCARTVLGKERSGLLGVSLVDYIMKEETTNDILSLCSTWSTISHLDVEDIERTPAFSRSLQRHAADYGETGSLNFLQLLRRLKEMSQRFRRASCVVITRPPEIISCFYIPYKETGLYIIFDSHPRPNLHPHSAAFILYGSAATTASYLAGLMDFDPALLVERGVQWEAQLLRQFSGHIFLAPANIPDARLWEDAALEASLQLLSARAAAAARESDLLGEITALRLLLGATETQEVRKPRHTRTIPLPPSPEFGSRPKPRRDGIISGLFERGGHALTSGGNPSSASREPSSSKARSPVASSAPSHIRAASYGGTLTRVSGYSADASTSSTIRTTPVIRKPVPPTRSSVAAGKAPARAVIADDAAADLAPPAVQPLQIREPMSARGEHSTPTFRCGVCFDEHTIEDVAQVMECGHRYCRDCLHHYVVAQVEARVYPMKCPTCMVDTKGEPSVLENMLIQQLGLSDQEFARFVELEMAPFSVVVQCRTCNNSFYVDKEELEATEIIICPLPRCIASWCRKCNALVRPSAKHTCDGTEELDRLMGERGWKYCPGCRTPAEKIDGCNHITCTSPGCTTHFCYHCGATIIRSSRGGEIAAAITRHYRRCSMFDRIPDRPIPP